MPPRPNTPDEVRQAREQQIRADFKAGFSMPTLAWWYHGTLAEIEDVIRRSHFPNLEGYDHAEDTV